MHATTNDVVRLVVSKSMSGGGVVNWLPAGLAGWHPVVMVCRLRLCEVIFNIKFLNRAAKEESVMNRKESQRREKSSRSSQFNYYSFNWKNYHEFQQSCQGLKRIRESFRSEKERQRVVALFRILSFPKTRQTCSFIMLLTKNCTNSLLAFWSVWPFSVRPSVRLAGYSLTLPVAFCLLFCKSVSFFCLTCLCSSCQFRAIPLLLFS